MRWRKEQLPAGMGMTFVRPAGATPCRVVSPPVQSERPDGSAIGRGPSSINFKPRGHVAIEVRGCFEP